MANNDFGSLGGAYSILGQATTAEYNRRKKEEDKERRRARRDQVLGYLTQPLLKKAGEALSEGVSDLFQTSSQKKAAAFLESEEFLIKKRKQDAFYNGEKSFRERHQAAMDSDYGKVHHYTQQRYNQKVAEFNRTYPEKEYKEGVHGLFWDEAQQWAEKAVPHLDKRYATSFEIRSGEDVEAAYKRNIKSDNFLQELASKTTRFFTGKDYEDVRERRLQYLEEKMQLNRSTVEQVKEALGREAPIKKIVSEAQKIEEYKVGGADTWPVTNRSAIQDIPVKYPNGTSMHIKAYQVTRTHPNDSSRKMVTWEPVKGNTRSMEGVAAFRAGKGLLGTTTESTEVDTGLGYNIKVETTTYYNADQTTIQESKNLPQDTMVSPTLIGINATQTQVSAASEQFKRAERSILGRDGEDVAEKVDFFITQGLGKGDASSQEKARGNNLYRQVHALGISAHSRNLNEDGVTLGLENSMSLAAIAKARHIGSLRIIDEDEYWDSKKDFDEVDFEDSTHLNHSNFKNASSVYLLDAFYSSSSKGGEADVRLSTEQVVALAEDAIQSFGMLPAPARAVFLEFFNDHNEKNKTSIFGQTYQGPKGTAPTSFMNHFLIIDHTLRASGS